MTALVPFNPANMAVAFKKMARSVPSQAGFLKMEKTGEWVVGVDGTPVEDDAEFIIHPANFSHGYVAWESDQGGNKLGEVMAPISDPLPDHGPVPDGADNWQFQLGMGLMDDDGQALLYRATSVGGTRAIAQLGASIGAAIEAGEDCVPVVTLSSESYKHKKYGKIFNPIITVERWIGLEELEAKLQGGAPAESNGKAKPAAKAPAKTAAKAPAKAPAKTTKKR